MSWEEVSILINQLASDIKEFFKIEGEKIDVISPMLRTGGITGGLLSIKLKVVPILPIQFKYFYKPTIIKQIISVPEILVEIPKNVNILLCEGNTNSGSIAIKASKVIKEKYPFAKIYLATLTKVYGGPEKLEGIEKIFCGRITNESFKASAEQVNNLNLRKGVTIFPWEDVSDELADINNSL